MKRKLISLCVLLLMLSVLPISVMADTQTKNPPKKPGVIFVVIRGKGYDSGSTRHSTRVSVTWGSFRKSQRFPSVGRALRLSVGVVIRLRHDNSDSVPITVDTDGQIEFFEQTARSPKQWTDSNWEQVDW